jgi:hypothetical protein
MVFSFLPYLFHSWEHCRILSIALLPRDLQLSWERSILLPEANQRANEPHGPRGQSRRLGTEHSPGRRRFQGGRGGGHAPLWAGAGRPIIAIQTLLCSLIGFRGDAPAYARSYGGQPRTAGSPGGGQGLCVWREGRRSVLPTSTATLGTWRWPRPCQRCWWRRRGTGGSVSRSCCCRRGNGAERGGDVRPRARAGGARTSGAVRVRRGAGCVAAERWVKSPAPFPRLCSREGDGRSSLSHIHPSVPLWLSFPFRRIGGEAELGLPSSCALPSTLSGAAFAAVFVWERCDNPRSDEAQDDQDYTTSKKWDQDPSKSVSVRLSPIMCLAQRKTPRFSPIVEMN